MWDTLGKTNIMVWEGCHHQIWHLFVTFLGLPKTNLFCTCFRIVVSSGKLHVLLFSAFFSGQQNQHFKHNGIIMGTKMGNPSFIHLYSTINYITSLQGNRKLIILPNLTIIFESFQKIHSPLKTVYSPLKTVYSPLLTIFTKKNKKFTPFFPACFQKRLTARGIPHRPPLGDSIPKRSSTCPRSSPIPGTQRFKLPNRREQTLRIWSVCPKDPGCNPEPILWPGDGI